MKVFGDDLQQHFLDKDERESSNKGAKDVDESRMPSLVADPGEDDDTKECERTEGPARDDQPIEILFSSDKNQHLRLHGLELGAGEPRPELNNNCWDNVDSPVGQRDNASHKGEPGKEEDDRVLAHSLPFSRLRPLSSMSTSSSQSKSALSLFLACLGGLKSVVASSLERRGYDECTIKSPFCCSKAAMGVDGLECMFSFSRG